MSEIIKVVANEEGRYPITLFGTHYEIEPVKSAKSATVTANKARHTKAGGADLPEIAKAQDPNATPEPTHTTDEK